MSFDSELLAKLLDRSDLRTVNEKDENGWTPLMFSVQLNAARFVQLLMRDDRVDPNIKDNICLFWINLCFQSLGMQFTKKSKHSFVCSNSFCFWCWCMGMWLQTLISGSDLTHLLQENPHLCCMMLYPPPPLPSFIWKSWEAIFCMHLYQITRIMSPSNVFFSSQYIQLYNKTSQEVIVNATQCHP